LVEGGDPDERTAALVAVLSATGQAGRVLAAGGSGSGEEWTDAHRRAADRRAKEIARRSWGSEAVRAYVQEISAAIVVGASVAATAAATSSSTIWRVSPRTVVRGGRARGRTSLRLATRPG